MTQQAVIDLKCPKCASKGKVTVYQSINVSLDASLREKLLNGKINIFHCSKCAHDAFISVPLLYHDMDRKFMVQFFPFSLIKEKNFLQQFTSDAEMTEMQTLPRKTKNLYKRIQVVFDMGELVRYVVFRERLYEAWKEAS